MPATPFALASLLLLPVLAMAGEPRSEPAARAPARAQAPSARSSALGTARGGLINNSAVNIRTQPLLPEGARDDEAGRINAPLMEGPRGRPVS